MKSVYRTFVLDFLSNHKLLVFTYTLLVLLTYAIGTIGIPNVTSSFLNSSWTKKSSMRNIQSNVMNLNKGGWIVIATIFSFLFVVAYYLKSRIQNKLLIKGSSEIRMNYIKAALDKLLNKYEEIQEATMSHISNIAYWASRYVIKYMFEYFIPLIVIASLIIVYFFYYNHKISLLILVHLLVLLTIIYFTYEVIMKYGYKQEKSWININAVYGDKIKNLMNIIFDNSVDHELAEIQKTQDEMNAASNVIFALSDKLTFLYNTVIYSLLPIFLFLILKTDNINYNKLSAHLMIILVYINILYNFVVETIFMSHQNSRVLILDEKLEFGAKKPNCDQVKPFYHIRLKNVYYRYDKNQKYILNNLSIDFAPKKINVIFGKSGSGKSTIMKLLIKMYRADKGNIYFDNIKIDKICPSVIRNNIYYVNQRTILFDKSIIENIQYGNQASKEKIISLFKKYDLLSYFDSLSLGINSYSGVNGSNLSLGMQKIIMVSRGILKPNKSVVIFDEPLTSLDAKTRQKIIRLIVRETIGKTVIIISHEGEIRKYANKIINLK
tara:strand:+ start:6843 stop:8495 length:1653 start_codon:yes stop_codon:yes gene_type:complete